MEIKKIASFNEKELNELIEMLKKDRGYYQEFLSITFENENIELIAYF